jgi:uncharacterized RDD family membrane protein YckC
VTSVIAGTDAGFGRRVAALLYDCVLLLALLMLYTGIVLIFTRHAMLPENSGGWVYLYRAGLVGMIGGYYVLNWMRSGQTLGMRAWRLRTVTDFGKPMKIRSALLRFAWGIVAWGPAALGVLWLYVDRDRLALHDRLSHTRVIKLARS